MKMNITPGQIRISNLDALVLAKGWGVRVLEFDLDSKYADATTYNTWEGNGHRSAGVMLFADERTLNWDEDVKTPTNIEFPGNWHIMAQVSKYTLRVVLWRGMWLRGMQRGTLVPAPPVIADIKNEENPNGS